MPCNGFLKNCLSRPEEFRSDHLRISFFRCGTTEVRIVASVYRTQKYLWALDVNNRQRRENEENS